MPIPIWLLPEFTAKPSTTEEQAIELAQLAPEAPTVAPELDIPGPDQFNPWDSMPPTSILDYDGGLASQPAYVEPTDDLDDRALASDRDPIADHHGALVDSEELERGEDDLRVHETLRRRRRTGRASPGRCGASGA